MPTAIYDSSLITQRARDKAIAQQVQQRNAAGQQIITPQGGYSAFTIADKNDGAISFYRKEQGYTTVDKACLCEAESALLAQSTEQIIIEDDYITITHNYPPLLTNNKGFAPIVIIVQGNGIVEWGDGTTGTFISNGDPFVDLLHSYDKPGTYTIILKGIIIYLSTSFTQGVEQPNYPDVTELNLVKTTNLTGLEASNKNLTTITNLDSVSNKLLQIGVNGAVFREQVYPGNTFIQLLSLIIQYNTEIPIIDFSKFVNLESGDNTLRLLDILDLDNIINITTQIHTIYINNTSLTQLDLSYLPNLDISYILNNNDLTDLNVSNTEISSLFLIGTNTNLKNLNCSNCLIDQISADDIATELYNTGVMNGTLTIETQKSGNIDILTQPFIDLSSLGWVIN